MVACQLCNDFEIGFKIELSVIMNALSGKVNR